MQLFVFKEDHIGKDLVDLDNLAQGGTTKIHVEYDSYGSRSAEKSERKIFMTCHLVVFNTKIIEHHI